MDTVTITATPAAINATVRALSSAMAACVAEAVSEARVTTGAIKAGLDDWFSAGIGTVDAKVADHLPAYADLAVVRDQLLGDRRSPEAIEATYRSTVAAEIERLDASAQISPDEAE